MPNIKSAKKRVKVAAKKTLQNQMIKAEIRTITKKFYAFVESNNKAEATDCYVVLIKFLDQAESKGIYHKNTVSRKKSSLTLTLNKLS